jgi:hypothetical protein
VTLWSKGGSNTASDVANSGETASKSDLATTTAEDAPPLEPAGDVPNVQNPKPTDPDDALRDAIRAALDAGDLDRVHALTTVLKAARAPAAPRVVDLAARRRERGER